MKKQERDAMLAARRAAIESAVIEIAAEYMLIAKVTWAKTGTWQYRVIVNHAKMEVEVEIRTRVYHLDRAYLEFMGLDGIRHAISHAVFYGNYRQDWWD